MNNAGASTTLAAHSSVCDVCQGFGDWNNLRGYVSEGKHAWRNSLVYTYVHHANIEPVIASAEAGCKLCKLIRQGLGKDRLGKGRLGWPSSDRSEHSKDNAESSTTQDPAQPDPVLPVVQSDEDVLTASQLAELARREGISIPADLDIHGHGRVILQFQSDHKDQGYVPRHDKLHSEEQILVQTTSGLRCHLKFFNSSGISRSHEGITELSNLANAL